jgi:hypothetical protein
MRLVRLILVVVVALTTGAQLWQENRRLKRLAGMPGPAARDHYEATRARDERLMVGVTAALVVAAAAALVVLVKHGRAP